MPRKSVSKKYVIIPGCSDLNRGDQALAWETRRLAESANYLGDFYMLAEENEPVTQSLNSGIKMLNPILEHPSRRFKDKDNVIYTKRLRIKWGIIAVLDFCGSFPLLWKPTRFVMKIILPKRKKETIRIFEEAEAVFMKGGGLLQTEGGVSSTYSMYYWTFPLLLAHAMQKPVFVMPNSFGPLKGPLVKTIARRALKKCRLITCRESLSRDFLYKELGLCADSFADLAFMLKGTNEQKSEIIKRYNLPNDKKLISITMRPFRFSGSKNPQIDYLKYKMEMAEFIHRLYAKQMMPVIVEHTHAIKGHENDGACIKDVVSMLKEDEYRIVSDQSLNCNELKTVYSIFDYIVGTRFHSVVFSFCSNVPGIAISYAGNKAVGIMHDIGLDEYAIRIQDVTADALIEKFDLLQTNESAVKEKISYYCKTAATDREELVERCRGKNN